MKNIEQEIFEALPQDEYVTMEDVLQATRTVLKTAGFAIPGLYELIEECQTIRMSVSMVTDDNNNGDISHAVQWLIGTLL